MAHAFVTPNPIPSLLRAQNSSEEYGQNVGLQFVQEAGAVDLGDGYQVGMREVRKGVAWVGAWCLV